MRIEPFVLLAGSILATPLAAQAAPASSLQFDTTAMLAAADTFEFRAGSRVVGRQVVTLERGPDGFVFREQTTMPQGTQSTEVLIGPGLQMRKVTQEGEMAGQQLRINVSYSDGRATGDAQLAGPDGPRDVAVDAAVPAGVVDDNVLASLLPALPWRPGLSVTVPVFASGKNELSTYTLIAGEAVPIGIGSDTVEAYPVKVEGAGRPLIFYLRATAPHRLVRISLPGAPIEVVRSGAGNGH